MISEKEYWKQCSVATRFRFIESLELMFEDLEVDDMLQPVINQIHRLHEQLKKSLKDTQAINQRVIDLCETISENKKVNTEMNRQINDNPSARLYEPICGLAAGMRQLHEYNQECDCDSNVEQAIDKAQQTIDTWRQSYEASVVNELRSHYHDTISSINDVHVSLATLATAMFATSRDDSQIDYF